MPGLQIQLAERQIDLGDLRLLQRHVLTLEVRAAVGLRRIQEKPEELVGQVVVRLHVLEVRLQVSASLVVSGKFVASDVLFRNICEGSALLAGASPVVCAVYAQYIRQPIIGLDGKSSPSRWAAR